MHRAHAASVAELLPPDSGVRTDAHTVNREACRGAAGAVSHSLTCTSCTAW